MTVTATSEVFIGDKKLRWKKAHDAGHLLRTKDIGRQGWNYWKSEALTLLAQTGGYPKVYAIERLRHVRNDGRISFEGGAVPGDTIYRIGYFALSPKTGRWLWGQYAPLIPEIDLKPLLDTARRENTIR